jgi:hypothetical protein
MTKKAKKPIEGELTLKDLRAVVGGGALIGPFLNGSFTAHARHNAQHHGHGHRNYTTIV